MDNADGAQCLVFCVDQTGNSGLICPPKYIRRVHLLEFYIFTYFPGWQVSQPPSAHLSV